MRRRTLLAISAAALTAAAALVVLVVVLSGGHKPSQHRSAAKPIRPTKRITHRRAHARVQPAKRMPVRHRHTRVTHTVHPAKKHAARTRRHARPHAKLQRWTWQPDETSVIAATRVRSLAVYSLPRAHNPVARLSKFDSTGTKRVLLVRETRPPNWVHVYLPVRPNGSNGWVPASAVKLLWNPYRIVVGLRAHRMDVWHKHKLIVRTKVVVGKPSTPTPTGTYFIVNLLKPPDPNGDYGPYAYDLSAHSTVFRTFAGGDGHIAIHGTNAPWLLGQIASHGCIRVSNSVIRKLARVLPLGTPVLIRR